VFCVLIVLTVVFVILFTRWRQPPHLHHCRSHRSGYNSDYHYCYRSDHLLDSVAC